MMRATVLVAVVAMMAVEVHAAAKMPKGLKKIPRYEYRSVKAENRILKQLPTVIVGGDFASAAVEKWSPEYFTEHWTSKRRLGGLSTRLKTVAGKWKFVYTQRDDEEAPVQSKTPYNPLRFAWDEEAVTLNYTTMAAFLSGREARAADNVSLYLQDTAQRHQSGGKSPGTEIQKDIDGFKWLFLDWMKSAFRWFEDGGENEEHAALNRGEEDTLQMWIGEPQLVTPLHYDVVFSVLHQIRGVKRIHMWPPSEYMKLCAHPSTHPSPRGSAVTDLGNIPASCPSFSKAKDGMVVSLVPGEALYMPQGWWHHIEQEDNNELPITLAMHYRPETWVGTGRKFQNTHDPMRKRIEVETALFLGVTRELGHDAIHYLRAVGEGAFDDPPAAEPTPAAQKMHERMWPDVKDQISMMEVLKKRETPTMFWKWLCKGRFDAPVIDHNVMHISQKKGRPTRKQALAATRNRNKAKNSEIRARKEL